MIVAAVPLLLSVLSACYAIAKFVYKSNSNIDEEITKRDIYSVTFSIGLAIFFAILTLMVALS